MYIPFKFKKSEFKSDVEIELMFACWGGDWNASCKLAELFRHESPMREGYATDLPVVA